MESWNLAIIFTLAFLGLVFIVLLLVFVILAYHTTLTISTGPYPGGKNSLETLKAKKKMSPFHKPHRKAAIATKANRWRVRRWLIKLDKIFIEIKLERKGK